MTVYRRYRLEEGCYFSTVALLNGQLRIPESLWDFDVNATETLQHEQIVIAGNDAVAVPGNGNRNNIIVVLVPTHRSIKTSRFNDTHSCQQQRYGCLGLFRGEFEFTP